MRMWRKKMRNEIRSGNVKRDCGEEKVRKEKGKETDGKEAE